jgi:copper oxidase (laccase) domain-containing protein
MKILWYSQGKWWFDVVNARGIDPWFDARGLAITKDGMVGQGAMSHVATMNQTHSANVAMVTMQHKRWISHAVCVAQGRLVKQVLPHSSAAPYPYTQSSFHCMVDADALITTTPLVTLSVRVADCLPIIIQADNALAIVHAGRVGTLAGISSRVCEVMLQVSTGPFTVWFGPCSCVLCYEIHKETATHFDLVGENKAQIQNAMADNAWFIYPDGHPLCTQCNGPDLYSYRAGDATERNVFFMANNGP